MSRKPGSIYLFRHRKCRYKGLEKNTAQLQVLFAIANWCCCSERCACRTRGVRPEGENRGDEPRNGPESVISG